MLDAVPRTLTLALAEGPLEIDADDAPSPDALWSLMSRSAAPLALFDWNSAFVTHANDAMERHMGVPARELLQWTGRRMMPTECGLLTDVISARLHAERRYVGPTVLRHADRGARRTPVDIAVLRHGDLEYGVDLYLPEAPSAEVGPPRLLVVDDDDLVSASLVRVFRPIVEVVTARDGYEGLRRLAADPAIRCVVSDVEMPGHGVPFWRACRLLRPDLEGRFLFFSGGPSTEREAPGVPFLPKLTSVADLRAAVAERLR